MSLLELGHPGLAPEAHSSPARRVLQAAVSIRWFWRLVATLALLGLGWETIAPPALGGGTSFVMTQGISMLPRYHAGDVVVLRAESSYHVGEVAGYHNLQLHEVVMHRIIAIRGRHYVFKGDNNDFIDSYEPTKSEIVGAEVIHLPGAARYVLELRNPVVAAVFIGLVWLSSFRPIGSRRKRRRHRRAA